MVRGGAAPRKRAAMLRGPRPRGSARGGRSDAAASWGPWTTAVAEWSGRVAGRQTVAPPAGPMGDVKGPPDAEAQMTRGVAAPTGGEGGPTGGAAEEPKLDAGPTVGAAAGQRGGS